jgi:hypothetical protein
LISGFLGDDFIILRPKEREREREGVVEIYVIFVSWKLI